VNLDRFVHLHVHSEFSLLDGLNGPYSIVRAAGNLGQPAVALTDHGTLSGSAAFWDAIAWYNRTHAERHPFDPATCAAPARPGEVGCHAAADCAALDRCAPGLPTVSEAGHGTLPPMKGILGIETYVAHGGRASRDRGDFGHLVLLAMDDDGWRNLRLLASRASLEGHYQKPRIDLDLLEEHRAGLVILTGCLGSHLAEQLKAAGREAADAVLARYIEIMGRENVFLEVQWHLDQDLACDCGASHRLGTLADRPCRRGQHDFNRYLLDAAERFDLGVVVTNDVHYAYRRDAPLEEILLANQQRMTAAEIAAAKAAGKAVLGFDTPEFYLKRRSEMEAAIAGWYEATRLDDPVTAQRIEARARSWLDATLAIAERAAVSTPFAPGLHFPVAPIPEGFTAEAYLERLVWDGAARRYPSLPESIRRTIAYELQCVQELGFAPYFLIVADFIAFARSEGIEVGLGRGSAPGSIISYVLGITDIDPVVWGLTEGGIGLSRFLNPTVLYRFRLDGFGDLAEPYRSMPVPDPETMEAELRAVLTERRKAIASDPTAKARWTPLRHALATEWTTILRYGRENALAKASNQMAADAIADRGSLVEPLYRWYRAVTDGHPPGTRNDHDSFVAAFLGCTQVVPSLLDNDRLPLRPDYEFRHSRRQMPDIDVDFDVEGRERVLRYVVERYGADRVCQIATFGTMLARSAIKDVARAKGLSAKEADELTLLVPRRIASDDDDEPVEIRLRDLVTGTGVERDHPELAELRRRMEADPRIDDIIRMAAKLEGVKRTMGTHACGVLITPAPVTDYVAVARTDKGVGRLAVHDGVTLTEKLGLLKVDFLGLKNLSVNRACVDRIRERRGIEVDWRRPPVDDRAAMRLLRSGWTEGIFQFGQAMGTAVLRQIQPKRTADLMVATALGRPGPAKYIGDFVANRARGGVVFGDPVFARLAAPVLDETYGILVYQEQVMRLAVEVAGFTLPEADTLRKATAKKDPVLLASLRDKFVNGAVRRGVSRAFIERYWDETLTPFARYSFNRAHATSYGFMAYTQAYLKAHYPLEFFAALMTIDQDEGARERGALAPLAREVEEAKRMGIAIRPIDINRSTDRVEIEEDADGAALRIGFGAIKGIGRRPIETILATRAVAPFQSFADFLTRCVEPNRSTMTKTVVINLIKVGAFDAFDDRSALLDRVERYYGTTSAKKRAEIDWSPVVRATVPNRTHLAWEADLLGFYLSSHPSSLVSDAMLDPVIAEAETRAQRLASETNRPAPAVVRGSVAECRSHRRADDDALRVVVGVVSSVTWRSNKSGVGGRIVGTIEDATGTGRFTYWQPRPTAFKSERDAFEAVRTALSELNGSTVALVGRYSYRERWMQEPELVVEAWTTLAAPATTEPDTATPVPDDPPPSPVPTQDEVLAKLFGSYATP
jgi:DNA polymerase III alpha subunit